MTTHLNSHPRRHRADIGQRAHPPAAGAHRADGHAVALDAPALDTPALDTPDVNPLGADSTVAAEAVASRAAPTRVPARPTEPTRNDVAEWGQSWDQRGPGHPGHTGGAPSAVRVEVDNRHCAVFGICVQEAPQVFDLGVDGRLRYTSRPDPADAARVRQAARVCPMQAITVTDRP